MILARSCVYSRSSSSSSSKQQQQQQQHIVRQALLSSLLQLYCMCCLYFFPLTCSAQSSHRCCSSWGMQLHSNIIAACTTFPATLYCVFCYSVLPVLPLASPALPSPEIAAAPPGECSPSRNTLPVDQCTKENHLAMHAAVHLATCKEQYIQYVRDTQTV
jgi:hypothetical protein